MNNVNNGDPFWSNNSKLSVKEIEKNFPEKIAQILKVQKAVEEKEN
ncbi:hypothetical protein HYH38_16110 [Clostridium botulinum]|nr:hypothetical protein [Clostridium botulinum]MBY6762997.1 hypothetical protein [Clostridium botulinum]MBY6810988.1 hypothetical protein [Clostridium botulinum]MBY6818465.1 hypothetical protein [Clostridium botulinum]MBY6824456.1 hypothetical protein [Clostridium botulinum]MBY6828759.1 hypothetical protein [Clostridium botulinum]